MNGLYQPARALFLTGGLDWTTGTWRAEFLDDTYTFDDTQQWLSDVVGGSRLSTAATLTGQVSVGGGVADADDVTSGPVLSLGQTATHVIIYRWGGSDGASELVVHIDTFDDGTPVSYAGSGADVSMVWPNTTSRIFKL